MPSRPLSRLVADALRRAGQGRGAESLLIRNGRVSQQQARRTLRRATVLSEVPAMRSALMIGAVSAGHVDAFTDATRRASATGGPLASSPVSSR